MKWTKKPPSEPGWYWWRKEQSHDSIMSFVDIGGARCYLWGEWHGGHFMFSGGVTLPMTMDIRDGGYGEWSDQPIPTPEEPK
jgi:hypothetical protein